MKSLIFFLLSPLFFLSCGEKTNGKESSEITNARWFFYSYLCDLKGYDINGHEINSFLCNVKAAKIKNTNDTINVYFIAYDKDSSKYVSFKPLGLVGVMIKAKKKYLPIYNHIEIDDFKNDSVGYAMMKYYENLLKERILQNRDSLNEWLYDEAERRGIIK